MISQRADWQQQQTPAMRQGFLCPQLQTPLTDELGPDYRLSHGQVSRVISSLRSQGRFRHRPAGSGRKLCENLSIRASSVMSAVIGVELVLNFIVASAASGHRDNNVIRTYRAICDGHHKKAQYLLCFQELMQLSGLRTKTETWTQFWTQTPKYRPKHNDTRRTSVS